jgi:oleandomycin transport system permease protein
MSPMRAARHSATLAWRGLVRLKHAPDELLDVLLMPITFVLMFVFLFGNAIAGDWRDYLQFVLPGIAVQALMFTSLGTALALNTDIRTGVFDRFRSMPIARSAPLVGHLLSDLVKYVVSLVVVFGFGTALGFRTSGSALAVIVGGAMIVLFAFTISWIAALIGLVAKSPANVQALGLLLVLPVTFGSNVFVPTGELPGWLQTWVKINPVTQLSDAVRAFMLDQPAHDAPRNALLWMVGLIAVFAPLAIRAYRRQA